MKLDIEVWDVEITTGKMFHHENKVWLQFRRNPDIDVLQEIFQLRQQYNWVVTDLREESELTKAIQNNGDFRIDCIGAISSEVANAIAANLEAVHSLKCRKIQRLSYKLGHSCLYEVRNFHSIAIVEDSDIAI